VIEKNYVMSQLHNWYSSPNIQVIKSRGIRLAGRVAHRGEKGNICRTMSRANQKERDQLEDVNIYSIMTLQ